MTVETSPPIQLRGLDWNATFWSGVISGLVMLAISILLPWLFLGDALLIVRIMASIMLGPQVIPAQAILVPGVYVVAFITHFVISILYTVLIALVLHRYGIIIGFLGGAVLGAIIYFLNYYSFSLVFFWLFPYLNWMLLVASVLFGALAGSLYELFEDDRYTDEQLLE